MTLFRTPTLLAGLLLAAPLLAADDPQQPVFEPMTDQMLLDNLFDGATLEVRLNGDFNADGIPDSAFVGGSEEKRVLKVMLGYKDEFDWGHATGGEHELDVPLGAAVLSFKKGVLLVEDLTGGTTATATTYRYRWDAKLPEPGLRLIGLDAQRYSRTNSHDSVKISWNLLSGGFVSQRGRVNEGGGDKDEAYKMDPEVKTVRKSKAILLEATPNPDEIIDSVPAGK